MNKLPQPSTERMEGIRRKKEDSKSRGPPPKPLSLSLLGQLPQGRLMGTKAKPAVKLHPLKNHVALEGLSWEAPTLPEGEGRTFVPKS